MSKTEDISAQVWPESKHYNRSVRVQVSLYVCGVIFALMLILGYVIARKYVSKVTEHIATNLLVQVRSFSENAGSHIIAGVTPDKLRLNSICAKLKGKNPEVYWAAIADNQGALLAHTDIRQVVSGSSLPVVTQEHFAQLLKSGEMAAIDHDTLLVFVPIRDGDIELGRLGVASSTRGITEARRGSIVAIASVTGLLILVGIPATMLLLHRKMKAVKLITDSLREKHLDDGLLKLEFTSKDEFGFLAETLRVVGSKLFDAHRSQIDQEKYEHELDVARDIQHNILPRSYPQLQQLECFGAYQSAQQVGGDYFDIIECGNDNLGLVVADVSGKSLPGMLIMLLTRDIVKGLAATRRDPASLLTEANRRLMLDIKEGMFVTAFFGLLNVTTGVLTCASAGHTTVLKVCGKTGAIERIKGRGLPLGLVDAETFEQRIENMTLDLAEGDRIVMYTDGVTEAHNIRGELFGMERLSTTLSNLYTTTAERTVEEVVSEVRQFADSTPQSDDLTLLVVRWLGSHLNDGSTYKGVYAHVGN